MVLCVELAELEKRCETELSAMQQHIAPLQRALGLSFVPKPSPHYNVAHHIAARLPAERCFFTLSHVASACAGLCVSCC